MSTRARAAASTSSTFVFWKLEIFFMAPKHEARARWLTYLPLFVGRSSTSRGQNLKIEEAQLDVQVSTIANCNDHIIIVSNHPEEGVKGLPLPP
jgi:hypothetical protein